ncbi:hypothetical protein C1H46_006877 [Malus baccata]|uniref:HTH La-type RNA-binding domain-containing protein n=1 Tax=Malus baccata TaxID=106549 RepID=A0A540N942_MALBA|nr:hypothetical protein C1H46_006877 [Malus baccata]
MAMAADSSANHHSPRGTEFSVDGGGEVVNKRASLPSPWAKVVRGGEPEAVQSPPSSSSSLSSMGNSAPEQTPFSNCSQSSKAARSSPPPPPHTPEGFSAADSPNGHNSNAGGPKKLAWNKPSNGVVEVSPVTVMDASSWPALSESARASPKLPADSSPKTVSEASVSEAIVNQGSFPVSQGPVIAHSPNSKRHPANSAYQNSTPNHALARQRSFKRGGGGNTGGGHAHSGFGHPVTPPPPPPFPVFPILPNGYGNLVPAMPDPSPRDPSFRGSSWDARPVRGFVPQSHPVNDHRNSRRGNFVPRPRGDGHYHNNHGGKRDQDRGNYMNPRDIHMHQHRAPPMSLVRPLPPNTAAFPPQPARPFANPMGFPEFMYVPPLPLEPIRSMPPFITQAPHPAMFYPVSESPLPSLIFNQIEYYFSDANLIKDDFLRSNMDAQGWVPISLIANFPRVKSLTTNIQLILDSLRGSSIVEVQDDKVRRRNEWTKWISTTGQLTPESGSPSTLSSSALSDNMLANSFEKMTVEGPSQNSMEGKPDPNSVAIPESCSTESTSQAQLPNGDVIQTDH